MRKSERPRVRVIVINPADTPHKAEDLDLRRIHRPPSGVGRENERRPPYNMFKPSPRNQHCRMFNWNRILAEQPCV